jgi:hypothetical protein
MRKSWNCAPSIRGELCFFRTAVAENSGATRLSTVSAEEDADCEGEVAIDPLFAW